MTERYYLALREIVTTEGKVCDNFELCTCKSCQSSVSSWFIAHRALFPEQYKELPDGPETPPATDSPNHHA